MAMCFVASAFTFQARFLLISQPSTSVYAAVWIIALGFSWVMTFEISFWFVRSSLIGVPKFVGCSLYVE